MAERKENKGWKNLIPMKKGETRNPYGRKKGSENWSTIFKRLSKIVPKMDRETATFFGLDDLPKQIVKDSRTLQQIIAIRLLAKASNGDLGAINTLMDRTDGKPLISVASMDVTPQPLFDDEDPNSPFGFCPKTPAIQLPDAIGEAVGTKEEDPKEDPPKVPQGLPPASPEESPPSPAPDAPKPSKKELRRLKRLNGRKG